MSADAMFDVAVAGAGPAGLITGLALAEAGFKTCVAGPRPDAHDSRTAALFQGSIELLKRLKVWPGVASAAEPLDAIRLVDATGALFRAPEVTFHAQEIGQEAFGYNVPNAVLTAELERLVAALLTRIITPAVTRIDITGTAARLETTDHHTILAPLVAAADGRNSQCRAAAGITTRLWHYDQAAIVCAFHHSRPHKRVSTELHRRAGPLTVVPGPGDTSNLVWVEGKSEAARIAALNDAAFIGELEGHLSGLLGSIRSANPRRVFPLSGQTAEPLGKNRVALIGEAGHVIPPIGAQGLNLGLRDAATLADVASEARSAGADPGGAAALQRYHEARHGDVTSRVWTVDLLNRSLLSPYAPVHMLRGFGLFALGAVPPLRRRVMLEGMAPANSTPNLMRPPAHT